jgi:hypothetical protein
MGYKILYFAGTNICDDLFSNQLQSTTSTTTSVKIWMNLLQFLWQASLSCPCCLPLFLNFGKFPSIFRFTKRVENTRFGKFTLVNLPNQEFTLVKIPQVYLPPFTKICLNSPKFGKNPAKRPNLNHPNESLLCALHIFKFNWIIPQESLVFI